jgi:hypothetical protein
VLSVEAAYSGRRRYFEAHIRYKSKVSVSQSSNRKLAYLSAPIESEFIFDD